MITEISSEYEKRSSPQRFPCQVCYHGPPTYPQSARVSPNQDPEKNRQLSVAYHEAGHAVMATIVGRPIQKVTISAANLSTGGLRLGACNIRKGRSKPTKDWLEDEALIFFAGMVAESHVTGHYCERGAGQDLRVIKRLLSQTRATSQRQLEKLERRLLDKTEYLLAEEPHAKAIEMIAGELLEKTTISGRAVVHLYNQAVAQFSKP